ncbi:MAG: hypothetical protein ACLPPF_18580 [Rhodomicrobium sp.]
MRDYGRLAFLVAVLFAARFGACFAEAGLDLTPAATESETLFLDRLMAVESGGRLTAKNPATSAYGPFQFLSSTFLDVVQRNFPQLAAGKSAAELLNLRADLAVARNAALIYTRENASYLAANGAPVTATNLRLAFFAGPGAAVKVLAAKPEEPLSNVLSAAALEANPFLKGMTAAGLIDRARREAEGVGSAFNAAAPGSAKPKIAVRCNLKLVSCRKWLDLAEKRLARKEARLAPKTANR